MDPFLFLNAASFGMAYAIFNQIQSRVININSNFWTLMKWLDPELANDSGIPGALEAGVLVPLFAWGLSMVPEIGYMAPVYPSISLIPGSILLGVAAFGAHIGTPGYWFIRNNFGQTTAEIIKDFLAASLPAVLALFI
jgi:hypothetical protein